MYRSQIVLTMGFTLDSNDLCLGEWVQRAHSTFGFGILFFIPCAPPSSGGWSGDVGEDCLSA